MENKGPETVSRCVIIEARSQEEAQKICEDLCCEGVIDLDFDDSFTRKFLDVHEASVPDLDIYYDETYSKNGKEEEEL